MDDAVIDKKYSDFIEDLIEQVSDVLPEDINALQVSYLKNNMRKSMVLMVTSFEDADEFKNLEFEEQCFYLQVIAEWSFHKEIDLFRSGISPKHWKVVMNKIWYVMWEVMYACVKNDAPHNTTLVLVERFVNRTYNEAIEELKEQSLINAEVEELAKGQSNIDKMAKEMKLVEKIRKGFRLGLKRVFLSFVIAGITTFLILKFKTTGLICILTFIMVYYFLPSKKG